MKLKQYSPFPPHAQVFAPKMVKSASLMVGDKVQVAEGHNLFREGMTGTVRMISNRRNNDPLVHVVWGDLVMGSTYAARHLRRVA